MAVTPHGLTNGLHLTDLSIGNFRGIESLSISRLARVTLLTGRNGVGKTTVLEAVQVYAAKAHPQVLRRLLTKREEFSSPLGDDQGTFAQPDFSALFHGRFASLARPVVIGPQSGEDRLRLESAPLASLPSFQQNMLSEFLMEDQEQFVKAVFQEESRVLPWLAGEHAQEGRWLPRRLDRLWRGLASQSSEWPTIACGVLGPGLPTNEMLARYWDRVALTEAENLALQALRLSNEAISRVAMVGDGAPEYGSRRRRVVVRLRDHPRPVPLRSLGDGAIRLFSAALGLANCSRGFLLIDEAENGIHYSVQPSFWNMVLQAARDHNVQVLATTHSRDCVEAFAHALGEVPDADGALVRLDRDTGQLRAFEYTQDDIVTAAEQGIEVR